MDDERASGTRALTSSSQVIRSASGSRWRRRRPGRGRRRRGEARRCAVIEAAVRSRDPAAVPRRGPRPPTGGSAPGSSSGCSIPYSKRLLLVAVADDRRVLDGERRAPARLHPARRAATERHRHRHVRGLAGGRRGAVVEVEVPVEVGEPHPAERVPRPGQGAGQLGAAAAGQKRPRPARDRSPPWRSAGSAVVARDVAAGRRCRSAGRAPRRGSGRRDRRRRLRQARRAGRALEARRRVLRAARSTD